MSIDTDTLFAPLAGADLEDLEIHAVGGAVRDQLLGMTPHDMDYVVVGADPETLMARGCQPVGQDFPVFLHPVSHVELALARTERKTEAGHTGFQIHADPSVTLEMDLKRRDFTINAMAVSRRGVLTDPYGGQQDLAQRQLRRVSDAFIEDPLRVLRGLRFLAQLSRFDFTLEAATRDTLRTMAGSLQELSVERVTGEIERILGTEAPLIAMSEFEGLGVSEALFPELKNIPSQFSTTEVTTRLAEWIVSNPLDLEGVQRLGQRLRFSSQQTQCVSMLLRLREHTHPNAKAVVDTLQGLGWLRGNPPDPTFDRLLCAFDRGHLTPIPIAQWILWRSRARTVTAQPLIEQGLNGPALGQALYDERVRVLSTEISAPGTAPGL